jgi:hypothetical protein
MQYCRIWFALKMTQETITFRQYIDTPNETYLYTSGFWPRVRARALRAPVFLGHMPRQTGRCAPPAHCSFAASYSYPKNKNNLPNSCRPRKGHFSTLPPRPESIQSARPSIQSSELGPPPPHLQESVAPPFGSKGGGETHSL